MASESITTAKLAVSGAVRRSGISSHVLESRWRQERILILAYHGVAREDGHLCGPALYMLGECFTQRLMRLPDQGCHDVSDPVQGVL
jgi:hypothetical protein